jgi:hypothetical protein
MLHFRGKILLNFPAGATGKFIPQYKYYVISFDQILIFFYDLELDFATNNFFTIVYCIKCRRKYYK